MSANVELACPVSGDCVVLTQDAIEVLNMFSADILNTKVIDCENKLDRMRLVSP